MPQAPGPGPRTEAPGPRPRPRIHAQASGGGTRPEAQAQAESSIAREEREPYSSFPHHARRDVVGGTKDARPRKRRKNVTKHETQK